LSIASPDHYNDYSLPCDYQVEGKVGCGQPACGEFVCPDESEQGGDPHPDDCISDYIETSFSSKDLKYGYTHLDDGGGFERSIEAYTLVRGFPFRVSTHLYSVFDDFQHYKDEIDKGRPFCALVDVDGDGDTDHMVTIIGYNEDDQTVAFYSGWDSEQYGYTYEEIWTMPILPMGVGTLFGIYLVLTFEPLFGENTIISPNGGEGWEIGSTHDVKWYSVDTETERPLVNLVHLGEIEVGKVWITIGGLIAHEIPNHEGVNKFSWSITESNTYGHDFYGQNYWMELHGQGEVWGPLLDEGDSKFCVSDVEMGEAGRGEVSWVTGETYTINWNHFPNSNNVKLELYKYDNSSENLVYTIKDSTPNDDHEQWTVPENIPPRKDYLIKITSLDTTPENGNGGFDMSDEYFSIVQPIYPTLTITSPNGGEDWYWLGHYIVTWEHIGDLPTVDIDLYKEGFDGNFNYETTLVHDTENDGDFSGDLPITVLPWQYKISISGLYNEDVIEDRTDGVFAIRFLDVISPVSQQYQVSSQMKLIWNSGYVGNVKIELYQGTVLKSTIAKSSYSKSGSNTYNWVIPSSTQAGTDYKIKISSTSNTKLYEFSKTFSIRK
jgi:hypothetical protein